MLLRRRGTFSLLPPSLTIYLNNLLNPLEQERLAKTLSRLRQGNKQNIDLLSPPEERLKCIPCTGHSRIWLMPIDEAVFARSQLSGVYF